MRSDVVSGRIEVISDQFYVVRKLCDKMKEKKKLVVGRLKAKNEQSENWHNCSIRPTNKICPWKHIQIQYGGHFPRWPPN